MKPFTPKGRTKWAIQRIAPPESEYMFTELAFLTGPAKWSFDAAWAQALAEGKVTEADRNLAVRIVREDGRCY